MVQLVFYQLSRLLALRFLSNLERFRLFDDVYSFLGERALSDCIAFGFSAGKFWEHHHEEECRTRALI
jgi:hypothetical protein